MISAVARSPQGKDLVEFATINDLKDDWSNTVENGVTAKITGWKLSCELPPMSVIDGMINEEIIVTLRSANGTCIVNLCDLLAMASAYVKDQYVKIENIMTKLPEIPA